jgi:outer membrane immunogenic protein
VKELASAAVAALLASGSAMAADLPVKAPLKAPPIAASAYDWTGFYLGVHAGYGVARDAVTTTSAFTDTTVPVTSFSGDRFRLSPGGWLGGVQGGYNWQFAPAWVAGVEADWSLTDQHDSACVMGCDLLFGAFLAQQKLEWLSTVRGRLGYARDGWLWYVTAGGAWGRVTETEVRTAEGLGTAGVAFEQTLTGWTAGLGAEVAIAGNWTGRLEYLYVDLGHAGGTTISQAAPGVMEVFNVAHGDFRDNIVRLGLNYRFAGATQTAWASRPVATVSHDWTGFYLGGNIGYGVARNPALSQRFNSLPEESHTLSPAGGLGGGQFGYNWQIARNWVAGAEVDGQWAGQSDSSCTDTCNFVAQPNAASSVVSIEQKLRWLATARGRFGYAMGDWLAYFTGGGAWGEIHDNYVTNVNSISTGAQASHTKTGWTAGTGLETALAGRWTAKLEYLYVDLGGATDFVTNAPGFGAASIHTTWRDHIVRFGVNYSFGQPSTVIAKY